MPSITAAQSLTSIACPSCGKSGSPKSQLPPGAKVRCKGCNRSFEPTIKMQLTECRELDNGPCEELTPPAPPTAPRQVAHHDAKERATGVRVGANGYLIKPFTPEQLYAAMDEALGWHDEHQQRGTTGEVNFDIRSELTYLAQVSDMLADLFAHTPLTERHIKDLKQAIMEMGGNAIEWGHRKNADLVLRITYRIDPNAVTLIIQDQGPGFNPTDIPHAASEEDPIRHLEVRNELGLREGGFGIMLARGLVDKFWYNERGNQVTMVKHFEQHAEE